MRHQSATGGDDGDLYELAARVRQIVQSRGTVLSGCSLGLVKRVVVTLQLLLVDGAYVPTGNRPANGQGRQSCSGKQHVGACRYR